MSIAIDHIGEIWVKIGRWWRKSICVTIAAIDKDQHGGYYNWGTHLSEEALTKRGAEADALYKQAYEKFAAAVAINPSKHQAFYNWGCALSDQAATKEGTEAEDLYVQVCDKYAAAVAIKPDKYDALYNWGNALFFLAMSKTGYEANAILEQACEKYSASAVIKPRQWKPIYGCGISMLAQAKIKNSSEQHERNRLLNQAKKMMLKCESIRPGEAAYILACITALLGEERDCLAWLATGRHFRKLQERERLDTEPDFDQVRGTVWFKDFLDGMN